MLSSSIRPSVVISAKWTFSLITNENTHLKPKVGVQPLFNSKHNIQSSMLVSQNYERENSDLSWVINKSMMLALTPLHRCVWIHKSMHTVIRMINSKVIKVIKSQMTTTKWVQRFVFPEHRLGTKQCYLGNELLYRDVLARVSTRPHKNQYCDLRRNVHNENELDGAASCLFSMRRRPAPASAQSALSLNGSID